MPITSNSRLFVAPARAAHSGSHHYSCRWSRCSLLPIQFMPSPRSSAPSACCLTPSIASEPRKDYRALQWDEALASAAREHAVRMAQRNVLSHQLPGEPPVQDRATRAGARFSLIAENIAVAPSPAVIHSSWMQSPHHRENILDPELNVVGIAVVKGSDGLFAVQDFSQAVANLNLQQQEQEIISNLNARGLRATQATSRRA